jgi:subtilase family serine protease
MTHAPQPGHQPALPAATAARDGRPHPVRAATRAPHRWLRRYQALPAAAAVIAAAVAAGCQAGPPAPPAGPVPAGPPPLAACTRPGPLPCDARDGLHEVYGAGQLFARGITGAGTTIAVIMPGTGDGLAADLTVFDRYYRLPPADLQTVSWDHAPALTGTAAEYGDQEAVLDLEMAHFMAPAARLLLVATPTPSGTCDTGLGTAMTALGALARVWHIDVASFSWGTYEASLTACNAPRELASIRPGLQTAVADGVSVIAGSGDSGPTGPDPGHGYYRFPTVPYPTSDPLVTGVGGTTVDYTSRGTLTHPETAGRQDSQGQTFTGGAGRSVLFGRPAWQDSVAAVTGNHRGVVDVSMDAQAWSYIKTPGVPSSIGWFRAGGTSVSAPLFAGLVADAAQQAAHPLGLINPALYQMHGPADGILDITRGSDTLHGIPGYSAGPGYDLPTGIGTVSNATAFVSALARLSQQP